MNRMVLALAVAVTTIGTVMMPAAQTAVAADESTFAFQMVKEIHGPRGLGVEGYVHNGLPARITNVHLKIDSLDDDGTLLASASGWVLGDVPAGGRAYFYVAVSRPAATYRAHVEAFDRVNAFENVRPEAELQAP